MAYNPENPSCPVCQSPMRGQSVGKLIYWICSRSPDCPGLIKPEKSVTPEDTFKHAKNHYGKTLRKLAE